MRPSAHLTLIRHRDARSILRIVAVVLALLPWMPAIASMHRAGDTNAPHPLDAHLTDNYTGDLDALLQRKYIRVLTTYNRTNFFLNRGQLRGFEYALLKEYQQSLNKDITRRDLQVVFEFIPVARDRLIPGLLQGHGDIAAAGLTVTTERQEQVDFTNPYWTDIDEVLVSHEAAAPIRHAAELSAKRIFVRPSSSYHESLLGLNRQLVTLGKKPVRIVRADENLETEDILELVNSGAIARTICDSHIADTWAGVLTNIRVDNKVTVRRGADIAWAVRKTSPVLKASLNRFIKSHGKGTRLGNIYFKRYYQNKTWLKNPLGGGAGKRLETYTPLFREFAARYGFDWRLIGAMAYQESGFDQSKVSSRGAVGIMQIRPQTAADPKVGIEDVSSAEKNIHAAVKYLGFLRGHYFDDAAIRPRDQVRFSLAAYNAGPVRIRKARKLAGEMRLDPNRWFRNVEMAMLKIVGQETVRYVSNINKYYVIYRNSIERVEEREAAIERAKQ